MRDRLQRRLSDLKNEYAAGQKKTAELESNLAEVKATMERIKGAIQVIEEELGEQAGQHRSD